MSSKLIAMSLNYILILSELCGPTDAFLTGVRFLGSSHYPSCHHYGNDQHRDDRSATRQKPTIVTQLVERRQKKNKYGNFSKTDLQSKDPMELMIEEALEKNRQLVVELQRQKNFITSKSHNKNRQEESKSLLTTKPIAIHELRRDHEDSISTDISNNNMNTNSNNNNNNTIVDGDTSTGNFTIDPYDPTTFGYTELGTIVGAHGVKGEIKLLAVTDFASERLCQPGTRHLKMPNRRSPRPIQLLHGRQNFRQRRRQDGTIDQEYLIRLEGVYDRDSANKMRGFVLYAREEERPQELENDEYLVTDLVGLQVFMVDGYNDENGVDQSSQFVGKVNGVVLASEMSAIPGVGQDLLEILLPPRPGETTSSRDELVLIPFVPQLVPLVDKAKSAIYISPPFGLLNLTYVREEKYRIKGFLPPGRD